jgi:hypothetical protein
MFPLSREGNASRYAATETDLGATKNEELSNKGHLDEESRRERERLDALLRLRPESSTRDQLQVLHLVIGLRDREVAEVARMSAATIRRWRREGQSERTDTYDDLRVVVERLLSERMIEPGLVAGWLRSRNAGLGYERPLDALREGDFGRVMHLVECFVAGSVPIAAPGAGVPNQSYAPLVAPDRAGDLTAGLEPGYTARAKT